MFKMLLIITLIILVCLVAFIGYAYVKMYRPKDVEKIVINQSGTNEIIQDNKEYTIMTFNIGYAALGEEQDFFMDSGKNSGALSKQEVLTNLNAIYHFIEERKPDFGLLQEVDIKAKRSFSVNELEYFKNSKYNIAFALNYNVFFVPVPIANPHGNVKSGIATLTNAIPINSYRFRFKGKEPFVKRLFDLQRCFTITRFKVISGKELVIINTHFSAFDKGGNIRKLQLAQMQEVLINERMVGNYVILGGDFNHELPGTSSNHFIWSDDYPSWCHLMDEEFLPKHYQWAVDGRHPSIRANNKLYVRGENFLATIDGFVVSDNIEIISVKTYGEMDFVNSDHNPVELTFSLK